MNTAENADSKYYEVRNREILEDPFGPGDPFANLCHKLELEFLKPNVGDKVLDLGSGLGYKTWLKSAFCEVIGIETSAFAIKFAREHYSAATFLNMDTCNLAFGDEVFDSVICSNILEHLPEEKSALLLREAFRVLKEGGKLVGVSPINESSLFGVLKNIALRVLEGKGRDYTHVRSLARKGLFKELEEAGFKIVRFQFVSTWKVVKFLTKLFGERLATAMAFEAIKPAS